VTRVFFREIEVSGHENVPRDGAVIFVGNHPNSLLDPVLITTTCRRRVRFAAKETLFKAPPLRLVLWVLGSVPVRRRQDQVEGAAEDAPMAENAPARVDNSAAFDALFDVLKGGQAFGIFPEGISHTRPELAPLKTGAARIALGAGKHGIPVRVVPCGLTYRRRDRMRSRVLVQFGPPLDITADQARALGADGDKEAVRALTLDIERSLRALTINAPDFETVQVLEQTRRLYRPRDVSLTLSQRAEIMRRLIEHWHRLQGEPEVIAFYGDVQRYLAARRALGLSDAEIKGDVDVTQRSVRLFRHLFFLLVLVPFALPGIVLHAPVLALAMWAGEGLTDRTDVRATIKMVVLTVFTMASYGLVAGLLVWRIGPPAGLLAALGAVVGLSLSGYATIRVLEGQGAVRRGLQTLWLLLHLDAEVQRLRAQRDGLRARLLELIDRYMDPNLERIIGRAAHDDVIPWLTDEDLD
jgi:glycerol-3-phosphate O-acyltransferase / dihydroxyacetone phosphate acyltransferase